MQDNNKTNYTNLIRFVSIAIILLIVLFFIIDANMAKAYIKNIDTLDKKIKIEQKDLEADIKRFHNKVHNKSDIVDALSKSLSLTDIDIQSIKNGKKIYTIKFFADYKNISETLANLESNRFKIVSLKISDTHKQTKNSVILQVKQEPILYQERNTTQYNNIEDYRYDLSDKYRYSYFLNNSNKNKIYIKIDDSFYKLNDKLGDYMITDISSSEVNLSSEDNKTKYKIKYASEE